MKKNWITGTVLTLKPFRRMFLIMRLSFVMVLCCLIQVSASTYSQNTKLDINLENGSMKELFKNIKAQSEFTFVYNVDDIEELGSITCEFSESTVEEILDFCLMGTNMTYKVRDKVIVIVPCDKPEIVPEELMEQQPQKKTITGKVTDEKGESIPGVSIVVKGTTIGTISDNDGNYTLEIPDDAEIIEFSFIGMKTQEIAVGDQSTINITLATSVFGLDEVVTIGYGIQKKVNLTGAVETLNTSEMRSRPLTNSSQALQGKVAGAFVTQNSGQPGFDDAEIFIRGVGTFGNSAPLIIVDGVTSSLNDVNPKDIASVSVLKDAASTAIYGNRASNGVILVTTKRGTSDKMEVSYTGYYGVQSVTTMPEMLKGVEYLELMAEANYNTNNAYPAWYNDEFMDPYRNNTDPERYPTDKVWSDIIFQPANIIDNHVSISGGSKRFQYAASVGYLDQDGIVIGNNTKKLTMRVNLLSSFLNDKLKLKFRASGYDQTTEDMVNGMNESIYYVYLVSL